MGKYICFLILLIMISLGFVMADETNGEDVIFPEAYVSAEMVDNTSLFDISNVQLTDGVATVYITLPIKEEGSDVINFRQGSFTMPQRAFDLTLGAEYQWQRTRRETSEDEDGFTIHAGYTFEPTERIALSASYLTFEETNPTVFTTASGKVRYDAGLFFESDYLNVSYSDLNIEIPATEEDIAKVSSDYRRELRSDQGQINNDEDYVCAYFEGSEPNFPISQCGGGKIQFCEAQIACLETEENSTERLLTESELIAGQISIDNLEYKTVRCQVDFSERPQCPRTANECYKIELENTLVFTSDENSTFVFEE